MSQPKSAQRILLVLTLCSSYAIDAYGKSSASFLHPSTRQEGETMSFLAWIVLGLLAGFIGSKLVNKSGEGIFLDIILGIVGAVLGGWIFSMFGAQGVTGLNFYSLFVAVVGAILFLVIYHAVVRRT